MTLRTRLFFLVGFAVALAALPIVFFSRAYLMDAAVQREGEAFANTVSMVQDALGVRYLNLLVAEIESVLEIKADLRRNAGFAAEALRLEAPESLVSHAQKWQRILLSQGCHFAAYGPGGWAIVEDPLIRRATLEGMTDFKGVPVRSMIAPGSRRTEARMAVVRVIGERKKAYLLCFKPAGKKLTVVLAVPVTDTESGRKKLEAQVIKTMQDRLAGLKFRSGTSVAVIDSRGAVLAGKKGGQGLYTLPQNVLEKVRKGEIVEDRVGIGRETVLFRLAYFKALDWYVLASAPIRSIVAPAEALTRRILLYAAVLLLLILCVMLILSAQLSEPLHMLTQKITALASLDFSREKEIRAMLDAAEDLPLHRKDEVGWLALAFDGMTRALADNIQKLVESTAASQRMQGELNAARDIQTGILPPPDAAPDDPRCRIGAFLSPAKEVGGDLYDFFAAPDGRQALVIGDVSDKGVPAALFMSMTVTLVRCALAQGLDPAQAMRQINNLLEANNPNCMFVTLFIGLLDPGTGVLEYASGAHCPPFIVGSGPGAPVRKLEETSGPLVGAMPDMEYRLCRTTLELGECCFLYTDGISEAMNSSLEMFGEERLVRVLASLRDLEPDKVIKKVFEAVEAFREEYSQSDDLTMLCVRRA